MKFVMNGSLYLGSKPVMWSPVEKTALAEAEIEYHDHQSPAIWVKFPVVDPGRGAERFPQLFGAPLSVVIWTTTPWTIPSNRGIAFNPNIAYALYEVADAPKDNWARPGDRYLLAANLAETYSPRRGLTSYTKIAEIGPGALAAMVCAHPFAKLDDHWDYEVPMLPGDFVTDDAGTGFVHMAPEPRRRRLRAVREERPRRPDDPQRPRGLVLRRRTCPSSPGFRSSTPRARRARPTRRSSTGWSRPARCSPAAG